MPENNNSGGLVTVFNPEDSNTKNIKDWQVVKLAHPSNLGEIDFGLVTTTTGEQHIYEMQKITAKYSSHFVGSLVLKNGDLNVATRVDPLWFVLESLSSSKRQQQWQPYQQLDIPETVLKVLSNNKKIKQLEHFCRVNSQLGTEEDMLLYKFDQERVLKWLELRQKRVHAVLEAEILNNKERKKNSGIVSSKSQGFNLLEDEETTAPVSENATPLGLTTLEQSRILQHSIQVVSEYLSPTWRNTFLTRLGKDKAVLNTKKDVENKKKRPLEDTKAPVGIVSAEKKKPVAQSVGLKKLKKVSTKGMKSLSSFFGTKPKKSNKS